MINSCKAQPWLCAAPAVAGRPLRLFMESPVCREIHLPFPVDRWEPRSLRQGPRRPRTSRRETEPGAEHGAAQELRERGALLGGCRAPWELIKALWWDRATSSDRELGILPQAPQHRGGAGGMLTATCGDPGLAVPIPLPARAPSPSVLARHIQGPGLGTGAGFPPSLPPFLLV